MKVLYLISCFGHGRGGHFYSLRATAQEMSQHVEVSVLSIGTSVSPVLNDLDCYTSIFLSKFCWRSVRKVLAQIKNENAQVLHSFDSGAYFFARLSSLATALPVIHTKCGGPSPKRFYPKVKDLVLYSVEDVRFFSSSQRHKHTSLHHIPNRVASITQDSEAIERLRSRLDPGATIFLRIARFSSSHKHSIMGSVGLVQELNDRGHRAQLVVIGAIQDVDVFEEACRTASDDVMFITDDEYTTNASRLIDIADYVIGTGRGAMEAAVLGKIVLAPVANSVIPVLLTEECIQTCFEYNFSPRTPIETDPDSAIKAIAELIESEKIRTSQRAFLMAFSKRHFLISSVAHKYHSLYQKARKCGLQPLDIALHLVLSRRRFNNRLEHYRTRETPI
ncbi:hypothetical protein [Alkalispirochaeta alkalica]|uniref:hypothetical protein n=1 Tax=Alkalispirochaeta alkalica TaxID=46356 RepID=UPI00037C0C38|nr:hypothetical protein [Alkalispirochaeta alkalica]